MAIIRCPECGHQISDRAPICPSCGVEISGKITKCKQCGNVYFNDKDRCPNCNAANIPQQTTVQQTPATTTSVQQLPAAAGTPVGGNRPKKNNSLRIAAFVISLAICGGCYYFYRNAENEKQEEAYRIAMSSDDPILLQNFLNNYKDAPQAEKDSVTARIDMLQKNDEEWNNAVASGSKTVLEEYISNHPDSPKKGEAMHKIDSIDWAAATAANTIEAYRLYMDEHASGEHAEECKEALNELNTKTVQPEEKDNIALLFRHFFQSINSKNEDGLASTVNSFLSSFLGKTDATKNDVITFMHKIYKEDITNMNWRLNNDWKIEKKDVGGGQFEYTVMFTATQDIERSDPNKETSAKYNIKAVVGPEGKISSMNMVKILE